MLRLQEVQAETKSEWSSFGTLKTKLRWLMINVLICLYEISCCDENIDKDFLAGSLSMLRIHSLKTLLVLKDWTCMGSSQNSTYISTDRWKPKKGKLPMIFNYESIEFIKSDCSNVSFFFEKRHFASSFLVLSRFRRPPLVESEIVFRFAKHMWHEEYVFDLRFNNKRSSVSERSATYDVNSRWTRSCLPSCVETVVLFSAIFLKGFGTNSITLWSASKVWCLVILSSWIARPPSGDKELFVKWKIVGWYATIVFPLITSFLQCSSAMFSKAMWRG